MSAYETAYKVGKKMGWCGMVAKFWIANRLPKRLVQCVLIDVATRHIRDDESVSEVSFMAVYTRWSKENFND